jgi:hypothetical protein
MLRTTCHADISWLLLRASLVPSMAGSGRDKLSDMFVFMDKIHKILVQHIKHSHPSAIKESTIVYLGCNM